MARDREESNHSRRKSKRISSDERGRERAKSSSTDRRSKRRDYDESRSDSDDSYRRRKRSKSRRDHDESCSDSDDSYHRIKRSKSKRGYNESDSDSDDSYHRRKRSKSRSGSSYCSDSEESEPDRRKKKSRVITEDQIVEYMAKKSQKKAVKVAKKLKAQAVSGYSNASNPFGDSNLGENFVWRKKIERDVVQGRSFEISVKAEKRRQKERMAEIEKVKKRREERAMEKARHEEEMALLARERARAEYQDWEKREEEFHFDQSKVRSKIRLLEGRMKPIDILSKNLNVSDDFDIELNEPYMVFKGLTVKQMEELHDDIKMHLDMDRATQTHIEFWEAMMVVCTWELAEARKKDAIDRAKIRGEEPPSEILAEERGLHSSVEADAKNLLEGKSSKEIELMRQQIESLMESGTTKNVEYWEAILKRLQIYKAKACLKEIHADLLRRHLEHPEHPIERPSTSSTEPTEAQIRKWLYNETAVKRFDGMKNCRMFEGYFAKLEDFSAYAIREFAEDHGITSLIDFDANNVKIVPLMVKLFYANLNLDFHKPHSTEDVMWSQIFGEKIVVQVPTLGHILNCSFEGEDLNEIDYKDHARDEISHNFLIDDHRHMKANSLRSKARLIHRILTHTIMPRTGSYDELYENNYRALYGMYAGMKINWAKFIMDEICSFHNRKRKTIHYASYIMRIFCHFHTNILDLEAISIKLLGAKTLKLMKLPTRNEKHMTYAEWVERQATMASAPPPSLNPPPTTSSIPILEHELEESDREEKIVELPIHSSMRNSFTVICRNQRKLDARLTRVESKVDKMMSFLDKIWKKIGCTRPSTLETPPKAAPTNDDSYNWDTDEGEEGSIEQEQHESGR